MKIEGDYLMGSFLMEAEISPDIIEIAKKISQLIVNFDFIFLGVYDKGKLLSSSILQIHHYNLYDVDIFFKGKINKNNCVLMVKFFKYSKEFFRFDIITSHFDIAEKNKTSVNEKNVLKFRQLMRTVYIATMPLYALIGQEEFVWPPDIVMCDNCRLPEFWGFYSKKIVRVIGFYDLHKILSKSYIYEELPSGGISFALSRWNDIRSKGLIKLKKELHRFLCKKLGGKTLQDLIVMGKKIK